MFTIDFPPIIDQSKLHSKETQIWNHVLTCKCPWSICGSFIEEGKVFRCCECGKRQGQLSLWQKEISMAMQPVTDLQVCKVCIWAKWLIRLELIPVSLAWSDSESISTPPGWDVSPLQGYPPALNSPVTILYTWVERGTVRVMCLSQEHNTMSPARARTRTAQSGDERTNHEATAPPTTDLQTAAKILPRNQCVQDVPANKYLQRREGQRDGWSGNTLLN